MIFQNRKLYFVVILICLLFCYFILGDAKDKENNKNPP